VDVKLKIKNIPWKISRLNKQIFPHYEKNWKGKLKKKGFKKPFSTLIKNPGGNTLGKFKIGEGGKPPRKNSKPKNPWGASK